MDEQGRHLNISLLVRRGEDSIVRRRPPRPGVDEFIVEEIDSIESRRSRADALTRRAEKKKWSNAFRSFWQQAAHPHHTEVC